jgi:ABC-type transport system substrate-binding protein
MTTRRVLILAPILLILVLLQSYFWVPTYEQQTRGNPERLQEYITGSIGDASILNPILSADSPSSSINDMVFEGLIDRDEQLRFRGRLATSWEVHEEAYFYVNESARIPGLKIAGPKELVAFLKDAKKNESLTPAALKESLDHISSISFIPPHKFVVTRQKEDPTAKDKKINVNVSVTAPARIKLVVDRVDQDLFQNLTRLLGRDYFASFHGENFLSADHLLSKERRTAYVRELLPAIEHNPILQFHLRPGVKFHDGHLFDAYDVKFTFESIMNPKNLSPRIADYEPVKAVEVVDPLTVRIVYKRLYSPAIGTWSMGILPEHLLNSRALKKEALGLGKDPQTFSMRQSAFNRQPVGCGPYKFRIWKSDQYITMDRFDDYWEEPPNYKQYIFRVIPDPLTQEMEFYAGTIDTYGVQPHQVNRLEKDLRFQHFTGLSFGYTYIGYNMRRKPFDDHRVRKALGMAINTDKIIRYVLYGQGEMITGPFVKQTDFYNHNIEPIPYDPKGALKLLKEAGWERNKDGWLEKDGQKLQFTLITNHGNDLRNAILAIAQDAWKQIGIDVRTDLLEWSVFIQERVNKADFDALILGWQMGIDPDLYQIWHSSQTNPYQLNFVGFKNLEADNLIIKIRQEYDHDRQVEYCRKLHKIIAREQPYTFLYVGKWTAILDRRIVLKTVDTTGDVRYEKIKPTKTGNYSFHFNKWIKLPTVPQMLDEG